MKLSIALQFNAQDNTEASMAITTEQAAMTFDEFVEMATPALRLIHHNMQAYMRMVPPAPIVLDNTQEKIH